MKIFLIATFLFVSPAYACWQMIGTINYEKDEVKINQKVEHDKTYSFQAGEKIFNVRVPSRVKDAKFTNINFEVMAKKNLSLEKISEGTLAVEEGKEATYSQLDKATGKLTKMTVKLNHI